jgi:hypothetical protein
LIVIPVSGGSRLVTQADHARFAAELLRLFRVAALVEHPRRDLLLRAVSEHDNGWWEADAAPRLAADGRTALDFRDFPPDLRQEIWRRGVERFATESPYLGALLAAHALRLSEPQREDPAWATFRAATAARRDELLELAETDLSALADDDRWLALADSLSLAICTGEARFAEIPGWTLALPELPTAAAGGAQEVGLAPFPLAGATVFELSCRELAAESFPSSAALGLALALAPWRRLRVRLRPL